MPREKTESPAQIADATEARVGAADWTSSLYGAVGASEAMGPFKEVFWEGDDIIAICELFTFQVLAVARAFIWSGKLVLYVADNTNAERWMLKRVARNRLARHGLRLLQLLEARRQFHVTFAGAWANHNHSMDLLSRAAKDAVQKEMNRLGLREINLKGPWMEILKDVERGRPLTLPGGA